MSAFSTFWYIIKRVIASTVRIPEYAFKSTSSAVTVQNFPSGTANPNQINVSYTPLAQTGGFTFNYDPTAQRTPAVGPSKLSVSGVTDQLFSASSLNVQKNLRDKVPAGYYISKITSASGKATSGATTDETIKAFFALNPSFDTTTANNRFCCKVFQKIYFSVKLRKKTERTE